MADLITKLETIAGERKIIACPWHCDNGYRGCDACNHCDKTGSGFRLLGKFYPNSEDGWRKALKAAKLQQQRSPR